MGGYQPRRRPPRRGVVSMPNVPPPPVVDRPRPKPPRPPSGPAGVSRARSAASIVPLYIPPSATSIPPHILQQLVAQQQQVAAEVAPKAPRPAVTPAPRPEFVDWGSSETIGGGGSVFDPFLAVFRFVRRHVVACWVLIAVVFLVPLAVGICVEHPVVALVGAGLLPAVASGAVLVGRRRYRARENARLVAAADDQNRRWTERGDLW